MAERGWGRFILLGSESSFNIPVDMIHYGVSKTADVALARGLAKRMAGTGVTVNAVLPGPTLSEGVAAMLDEERRRTGRSLEEVAAEFVAANRPSSIIRRAASVEEVANMIVYVASRRLRQYRRRASGRRRRRRHADVGAHPLCAGKIARREQDVVLGRMVSGRKGRDERRGRLGEQDGRWTGPGAGTWLAMPVLLLAEDYNRTWLGAAPPRSLVRNAGLWQLREASQRRTPTNVKARSSPEC
jgi:hypothetical protein